MDIDLGWVWGVAGLALLAAETILPGFYLLWVGLAALVVCAGVVAFDLAATSQLLLFAASAIATCVAGWFVYQWRSAQEPVDPNDNAEQMVGSTGEVLEASGGRLRVKVRDSIWLADGPDLAAGTRVRVTGQHGTVLKVTAVE
ncbi:MAG TPA: NfeD family protein [Alphaproteobacteria bacterium]|nr:NfeD family protein [Alphaproteobacteria bacterium]